MPAVLELGDQTIENLSSTRVMRYISDRCILNERVFFVLFLDFSLSLCILMGFRLNVELLLRGVGDDFEDEKTTILDILYNRVSYDMYYIVPHFLFPSRLCYPPT